MSTNLAQSAPLATSAMPETSRTFFGQGSICKTLLRHIKKNVGILVFGLVVGKDFGATDLQQL